MDGPSIRISELAAELNIPMSNVSKAAKATNARGKSSFAYLTLAEVRKIVDYLHGIPEFSTQIRLVDMGRLYANLECRTQNLVKTYESHLPKTPEKPRTKFGQKTKKISTSQTLKKVSETQTQKILSNSKVVIDTCFAMNDRFQSFLETYGDVFQGNNIIVPRKVVSELTSIIDKNDNRLKDAEVAYHVIWDAIEKKMVELIKSANEDLIKTADQVIVQGVQSLLLKYDVLVCTQDNALTRDLYRLVEMESFSAKHNLRIASRYKNGKLVFAKRSVDTHSKPKIIQIGDRQIVSNNIAYSCDDIKPFPKISKVSPAHQQPLQVSKPITDGMTVYMKDKKPIILTRELARGGEGAVFDTSTQESVAKVYFNNRLTKGTQEKIELMVSEKVPDFQICWPQVPIYDSQEVFRGFLMPKASGKPLGHGLCRIPKKWLENNPNWTRRESAELVLSILHKIKLLHQMNIILGDINPLNILVENERSIYFVDCDSYQVGGYPCPVGTVNFTPPEIQGKTYTQFLRTEDHELFAVATLLFMIMLPGKAPFSHEGGENGARNIEIGHFPYCLGDRSNQRVPLGVWRYCWSHLSRPIKEAFDRSFHVSHRNEPRVSLDEWIDLFGKYLFDLSNPKKVFSGSRPSYGFDLSILPQTQRLIKGLLTFSEILDHASEISIL